MKSWGFADSNGDEITRGWQGRDEHARALAQRFADERGSAVDYWDEAELLTGEDGSITVEPTT